MSSLTGKDPKDTYKDLLQVSNSNSGIDGTLRNVEDGEGTSSPLMLSEDSVEIESQLVLSVAEGTAPMSVTSTTTVTNLDSDTVDGSHAADFATSGHDHAGVYSEIGHDHAGVYSEVGHDHAGVYSEVGHDHSGTYSEIGHDHSGEDINPDNVILGAADDIVLARDSAGVAKFTGGGDGTNWGGLSSGNIEIHGLDHVEAPVISNAGTPGATTYSYVITALLGDGSETAATHIGTTNTGNATLDGTNYNIITWAPITGALNYNVYRYAGGDSQGLIVGACSSPQNDIGLPATTTWPTQDTTGSFSIYSGSTRKLWLTPDLGGGTKEGIRIGDPGAAYLDMGIYGGAVMATFGHGAYRWETRWRHTDVTSGAFKFYSDTASQLDSASIGEIQFATNMCGSSDTQIGLSINNIWNQTGTSSGTDLLLYRTESALGSGSQLFIDAQVDGSSKFSVNDNGDIVSSMITRSSVWPNLWAPGKMFIKGANANTTNPYQPGGVFLLGGIGSGIFYVTDWSAITPGSTLTVNLFESDYGATTSYVITEGVDWDADTSNEATASSIKNAFDTKISDGSFSLLSGTYLDTTSVVILVKDSVIYQSGAHSSANGIEWVDPTTAGGTPAIIIGGGLNNLGGPSISGSPRFQQTLQVNNGSSVTGPTQPISGKVYAGGYIVGEYGSGLNGLAGAESAGPNPEPLMVVGSHCKYDSTGTGGSVFIKPGDGSVNMRIIDYTALTGKTITVTEYSIWNEDITYTITEGVDFDAEVDEVTTAANIVTALNNNYWYNEAVQTSGMPNIHWDREQALADGGFGILSVTSDADPALFVITNEDRGTVMVDGHLRFVDWDNPDGNGLHSDVGLDRSTEGTVKVSDGSTGYGSFVANAITARNVRPPQGTVTQEGTPGATTYYYIIRVVFKDGTATEGYYWQAASLTQTNTGNAVLDGTNYNHITWTAVPGASYYEIYSYPTRGLLATSITDTEYDDQGAAGNLTFEYLNNTGEITIEDPNGEIYLRATRMTGGGGYTGFNIYGSGGKSTGYTFGYGLYNDNSPIISSYGVYRTEWLTRRSDTTSSAFYMYSDTASTIDNASFGEFTFGMSMCGASDEQKAFVIRPTWNQSGTSSSTDLFIYRTNTAVGSGTHYFMDAQVGGVSKFTVDTTGRLNLPGDVQHHTTGHWLMTNAHFAAGGVDGAQKFVIYASTTPPFMVGVNTAEYAWSSSATYNDTQDLGFKRSSAGVFGVTSGVTTGGYGSATMSNLTLTALSTPDAPVITNGGTPGATAYSYKVVAKLADGSKTLASSAGSTATGNATLDADNYNIITWSAVTGAHTYDVYRSASAGNPASTGLLFTSVSSPQHDHGEAAAGAEPTANTTGVIDGPNFDVTNAGAVTATKFTAGSSYIDGATNTAQYSFAYFKNYPGLTNQWQSAVSIRADINSAGSGSVSDLSMGGFVGGSGGHDYHYGIDMTTWLSNYAGGVNPTTSAMLNLASNIGWNGSTTTGYGIKLNKPVAIGSPNSGTFTNWYGFYMDDHGTAGTGITYTNPAWGMYVLGTRNYIAGLYSDGLSIGSYSAVADGKILQTVALNDNTGDEVALDIVQTVNKSSSGNDTSIRVTMTDTNSPGISKFFSGVRGSNEEFVANWGYSDYPSIKVKGFSNNGYSSLRAEHSTNTNYIQISAGGNAASNGMQADDKMVIANSAFTNGVKFFDMNAGDWYYTAIAAAALRLGERGGGHAVDVGIRRYGSGVAQIFNGDTSTPASAKLMVTDLVAPDGSPDALTIANDGGLTANVSLTVAASAKVVWDTNVYEYADTVTLTDESDTPIFEIAIADGDMIGGKFSYTICASDGTDHQAISGDASFAAVRKAGTPETYHVDIDEHLGTDSTAVSTGTLTDAFSIAGASGKITVGCTANSSIAGATITLRYKLTLHSSKAVTKKT